MNKTPAQYQAELTQLRIKRTDAYRRALDAVSHAPNDWRRAVVAVTDKWNKFAMGVEADAQSLVSVFFNINAEASPGMILETQRCLDIKLGMLRELVPA